MNDFRLSLRNYRCFSDERPLEMSIKSGLTGLVGPNNSGKSTLLRFFYDFRYAFKEMTNINNWTSLLGGANLSANFPDVEDYAEILTNNNERPMIVEVGLAEAKPSCLCLVRFTLNRSQPKEIRAKFFVGPENVQVTKAAISMREGTSYLSHVNGTEEDVSITEMMKLFSELGMAMYVGPFRNAISASGAKYYDLQIGTTFIQAWDDWKTGPDQSQTKKVLQVEKELARIFSYESLQVNATADKKSLQAIANGKPYRLRELGAGFSQFLLVFGSVALAFAPLLCIDEPELNLHPSLQVDFLTSLASLTTFGVIFATHSVGLARSAGQSVFSFQRVGTSIEVKPFEATRSYLEFLGEMGYSTFNALGFEAILMVEGVTEVLAVRQFLRAIGKDHSVVVLSLGGSDFINGSRQAELAELKRLSEMVSVLIDSETSSESAPVASDRTEFLAICTELRFRNHATKRRAFENYLTDTAIKKAKGESFRALSPYERLKDSPNPWSKSDNWRIAREMSKDEVLATDVGKFLSELP